MNEFKYWKCARCGKDLIDPEENPGAFSISNQSIVERKDYWLDTAPICAGCAAASGIPSIDEEYNANV